MLNFKFSLITFLRLMTCSMSIEQKMCGEKIFQQNSTPTNSTSSGSKHNLKNSHRNSEDDSISAINHIQQTWNIFSKEWHYNSKNLFKKKFSTSCLVWFSNATVSNFSISCWLYAFRASKDIYHFDQGYFH